MGQGKHREFENEICVVTLDVGRVWWQWPALGIGRVEVVGRLLDVSLLLPSGWPFLCGLKRVFV